MNSLLTFLKTKQLDNEAYTIISRIIRKCWRQFADRLDWEDFSQDVWLYLLTCGVADNIEHPIGYIYVLVRNHAYRIIGKLPKYKLLSSFEDHKKKPAYESSVVVVERRDFDVRGMALRSGLKVSTVQKRIERGWSIEDAISKPVVYNPIDSESIKQKALVAGVKYKTVWQRLNYGYTLEEALTPGRLPRR